MLDKTKNMKAVKMPPYVVIDPTKEVIFYISKNSDSEPAISIWMKKLQLPNYKGMVIKSKCIFNRLRDQDCK